MLLQKAIKSGKAYFCADELYCYTGKLAIDPFILFCTAGFIQVFISCSFSSGWPFTKTKHPIPPEPILLVWWYVPVMKRVTLPVIFPNSGSALSNYS
jgi:hypothetical protein